MRSKVSFLWIATTLLAQPLCLASNDVSKEATGWAKAEDQGDACMAADDYATQAAATECLRAGFDATHWYDTHHTEKLEVKLVNDLPSLQQGYRWWCRVRVVLPCKKTIHHTPSDKVCYLGISQKKKLFGGTSYKVNLFNMRYLYPGSDQYNPISSVTLGQFKTYDSAFQALQKAADDYNCYTSAP